MHDIHTAELIDAQHQFFLTGATKTLAFRLEQLKKLQSLLAMKEADIISALEADLHKSPTESLFSEILIIKEEIGFIIKRLKKWMKAQRVPTPFPALFPGSSKLRYEPYGTSLIISPWNYPYLLSLSPLIGAMSAGNCAILKPSEQATHTQNFLADLINTNFSSNYLCVKTGGPEQAIELLSHRVDYIFFTGSTTIGKHVLDAAAKYLTPVTLELGGKSPCVVDHTANIPFAARRIAWAKSLNAGQTCIAPDFVYVHEQVKDAFIKEYVTAIEYFFSKNPKESNSFGRIINQKHTERLQQLLSKGTILLGGQVDIKDNYVAPTLITDVSWDDPIMQEEIFGPILPLLTFKSAEEVIAKLQTKSKPLAFYLFTQDKQIEQKMLDNLSFGGGCINDCFLHLANLHLPFGGVGDSGQGRYHGYYSFKTFSHCKSIFKKHWPLELKVEYPPHTPYKAWWLRKLLRL